MQIFLWFLLTAAFIAQASASAQTVKVNGQVFCNSRQVRNVLVQLREKDTFDPDDTLASTFTDENGQFKLTGTEDEFTTIRPYIRITHTCDVKSRGLCHKTTDVNVPTAYINNGTFDMDVNLRLHEYKEVCN